MSIPRRDELPEDFYELRNIPIELPHLATNSATACPAQLSEILEYLSYEAPGGEFSGGEQVIDFQLEFLRTALVEQTRYWIWRFSDENGTECYVTVAVALNGERTIGYDESFGFTPEQFILADGLISA